MIQSKDHSIDHCEYYEDDKIEETIFLQNFVAEDNLKEETVLNITELVENLKQTSVDFSYEMFQFASELPPTYSQIINIDLIHSKCIESGGIDHLNKGEAKYLNNVNHISKVRDKRASRIIFPDTNWCGHGNRAHNYTDLGKSEAEDECCRSHDHCEYIIPGLSTRWQYFNHRLTTLSHCDCDDR